MVSSGAATVDAYLASIEGERRQILDVLRATISTHLKPGFDEAMAFGMPCYQVPLAISGPTYNGQPLLYIAFANQKQAVSLYLMPVYMRQDIRDRFTAEWTSAVGRLDMGKSCVRVKRLAEIPLDVVAWVSGLCSAEEFAQASRAAQSTRTR